MALGIQIVYDCSDPDRLARFYAAALRYKMQDPPEGFATWKAFLQSIGVPREEWNDASAVIDPDGKGPRIYFQKMDTPKPEKNRLHLDLNASGGRETPEDEGRRRIDAGGARVLAPRGRGETASGSGGGSWDFVTTPRSEGDEF